MSDTTMTTITSTDTETPLVLPFAEIGRGDLPRVGGKGANLGELTAAGLPVPDGFCVTTAAWDLFVDVDVDVAPEGADAAPGALHTLYDLYKKIDAADEGALDVLRALAGEVREILQKTEIPQGVVEAVREALQTLGVEHSYAVRSSATLEDLEGNSFAGQQDTYLNVRGEAAVLEAVRRCWASLFTDRAVTYRRRAGFATQGVKLAVVVQRMVLPEISGILFTADPVSGHRGVCSVDASWGLGEALVSGRVNADLYRVRKATGEVIEARVGDKQLAIWPEPDGGTRDEIIEGDRRHARVLDDAALVRLTALALQVERHYGAPQDIEWCMADDALFLVQARPITSLFPQVQPTPEDGVHVYASFNHIQVMLDPIAPLGFDSMRWILPIGRDGWEQPSEAIVHVGGRIYGDMTVALTTPPFRQLAPLVLQAMDPIMGRQIEAVLASPELQQRMARPTMQRARAFRMFLGPVLGGVLGLLSEARVLNAREHMREGMVQHLAQCQERIAQADTLDKKIAAARWTLSRVMPVLLPRFAPPVIVGGLSWRALLALVGDRVRPEVIEALTRGFEGNITTQMDLELGDMADLARTIEGLPERLADFPLDGDPATLGDLPGVATFLESLKTFIERYGHRAPGEIDLSRPRWREQPGALFPALVGMLKDPEPGRHRAQERRMRAEAEAAAQEILRAVSGGLLGPLRRRVAERLILNIRLLLALREHGKYYALCFFDEARKACFEVAEALVAQGRLARADEVIFLHLDELEAAASGAPIALDALIASRRDAWTHARALRPPRVMTSDGEIPALPTPKNLPPGAMLGVPASSGTIEGVARVIHDPIREVLHAGEILIAPFTDPGWTPLFVHASGLVLEVGGLMTHGSVVAREYGIPAVVGLDGATTRIRTGDRVRVDGTSGLVTILAAAGDEEVAS